MKGIKIETRKHGDYKDSMGKKHACLEVLVFARDTMQVNRLFTCEREADIYTDALSDMLGLLQGYVDDRLLASEKSLAEANDKLMNAGMIQPTFGDPNDPII